ncbi:MAG TPA: methyltransferase domain-containing protein [Thermoanaerobaculia bacterium]|nr:methyltransferase domain-containing protein [Thermoanaerobaculia bacterium]
MTSRARWNQIAASAPYFAVLAEPRFLGVPGANALAEFHHSGDLYVERILRDLGGRVEDRVRSVLEFGCGPGRLAAAFARRGFRVTATDVAPAMLGHTRSYAASNGLDIEVLLDSDLFATDRRFELVTCVLVLQHLAHSDALALLRRLVAHVSMGGFLHLQFPFRSHRSLAGSAALAARERIPALNAIANRRRGRAADVPLLVPQVHSLDSIVSELNALHCSIAHFHSERENELETVRLTVVRGLASEEHVSTTTTAAPARAEDFIDVRELMRNTPLDEWNRRAEEYFSGLKTYDLQLAKPFASPGDAPALLVNAGTAIQALHVLPGMTVIDFGAGTGWLTRALAQLGCRVISMDVSQTALDIGKRDLETRPLIGEQPRPAFLRFDGTRIALDDASVDRIICFDSFHHVPNPETVLREFARVLKPGGLAAFSEPGPNHSKSAQSQFEMRTYGVLENDIDLQELWPIARDAGFAELRVGVFKGDPQFIPLENFDDLLNGGNAFVESARWMRNFLENIRLFTLRKEGEEELDSRSVHALRADIDVSLRGAVQAHEPIPVRATIRNIGTASWLPSPAAHGGVCLGVHLYANHELVTFDHYWEQLPGALQPGEAAELEFQLPPLAPGSYVLEFDCVAQNVAWFAMNGSATKRLVLDIR